MSSPAFQINPSSWQDVRGLSDQSTSVLRLLSNNFLAVWAQQGGDDKVYGRVYNTTGIATAPPFLISSDQTTSRGRPSAAMFSDGSFVVAWTAYGVSNDVFIRRYNPLGTALDASPLQVNPYTSGSQRDPSVGALKNDGFIVTWYGEGPGSSQHDVFALVYGANGQPTTLTEFRVNPSVGGNQYDPDVATLSGGGCVVAWQSRVGSSLWDIHARRLDELGDPIDTAAIQVAIDGNKDEYNPGVAGLSNGGFVVVWQTVQRGGSDRNIYGRRFNSSGAALETSPFRISVDASPYQHVFPTVVALPDQYFLVTWRCLSPSEFSTCGRRYHEDGTAIDSSAFHIGTSEDSLSGRPGASALNYGRFVVTWTSSQDRSVNLYARIFEDTTVIPPPRIPTNNPTQSPTPLHSVGPSPSPSVVHTTVPVFTGASTQQVPQTTTQFPRDRVATSTKQIFPLLQRTTTPPLTQLAVTTASFGTTALSPGPSPVSHSLTAAVAAIVAVMVAILLCGCGGSAILQVRKSRRQAAEKRDRELETRAPHYQEVPAARGEPAYDAPVVERRRYVEDMDELRRQMSSHQEAAAPRPPRAPYDEPPPPRRRGQQGASRGRRHHTYVSNLEEVIQRARGAEADSSDSVSS